MCSCLYSFLEPFPRKGGGEGRGYRALCETVVKFQTLISRKRLEITLTIWFSSGKNRGRSFDWARFQSSRTTYKRESWSKFDFGLRAAEMVGNDSFPHQKMFGAVSKPLSTGTSEILIIRPKYGMGLSYYLYSKISIFQLSLNYQLSCFMRCWQSVLSVLGLIFGRAWTKTTVHRMRKTRHVSW